MVSDGTDLIDSIYEAAIVSERWPVVLERLAQSVDASLGSVFIEQANGSIRWAGTPDAMKLVSEFFAHQPPLEPIRLQKAAELEHDGFYTDHDFNDPSVFDHPTYTDFLYPRNYGWHAAAKFALPTGESASIGFERRRDRGAFDKSDVERLNGLRPHLGRAVVMAARLGLERAVGMMQALHAVGIPAAVLRSNGAIHVANDQFQNLIPAVVLDRRARATLSDVAADALLGDALLRLQNNVGDQSRSIPVAAGKDHPPIIFHLLPIRGAANDIFSSGLALLIATPVDKGVVPNAEVLQGLFDLTPAEARVARGIAEGKTIEALALASAVSRETIRTQLGAVLAKTGLNRQAELAALLSGSSLRQPER